MPEDETPAPGPGKDDAGVPGEQQQSGDKNSTDGPQSAILRALQLTPEEEERRQQLLWAATGYATDLGWRLIPLCWPVPGGKCGYSGHKECAGPGKRAILNDWPNVATSDPVAAARWWTPPDQWVPQGAQFDAWYPLGSMGVVLGELSGVFVLDVDPEHGGFEELERKEHEHGPLPMTRVHMTGGGGVHYFFRWPGFRVYNLKPWGREVGLDIKGDNGYVVLPPSRSYKGDYEVSDKMAAVPIADAPEWILEPLRTAHGAQHGRRSTAEEVLPTKLVSKYVEAAMKGEHYAMSTAPKGARNDQLFASACSLGSLGAHGFIDQDEALLLLQDAALKCDYIQDDGMAQFLASFRSGWSTGMSSPRDLSGVGSLADHQWPMLPWDELGLGDRLVAYFGDRLRWVEDWGAWMVYSGGTWCRRKATEAERLAQEMIRLLTVTELPQYSGEPDGANDDSPREQFQAWLRRQGTAAKITNTTKIGRGRPAIQTRPSRFDDRPMLLAVANGVIDLETGNLREHDPEAMITMKSPVPYDPAAACPLWSEFLSQVQPDEEMRAYLQRAMFYSATGHVSEQVFFLHHGKGANGKSVFHEVLAKVLGDYSQVVPVEALMASSMDRIPTDIARMRGRRFLQASESRRGKFLDAARIKQLVGGDTISARFMREDFFEFRPVGKIHMVTNHLPRIGQEEDAAIWRRIHMVRWPVQIPEAQRDGILALRLFEQEAPGILAWIVRGGMGWRLSSFLDPPDQAIRAKEEYRVDEDDIGEFLADTCEAVDSDRLLPGGESQVLYAHYKVWATANGFTPINNRNFIQELKNKGYRYCKSHGRRGFAGVSVRSGSQPGSSVPVP
jgi:putative DNA primase/helicase